MYKKIQTQNFLAFIIVFTLVLFKSISMTDPDFGWHTKMGEIILSSGIPKTDPFSYSMPSFLFVDHEWGTNTLLYLLYKHISWIGLSIIFSAATVLAMLIPLKLKFDKFSTLPFLLGGGSLLFFTGIRPQVISWLLFSVLITVFFEKKYYERLKFLLPLFFLLWANLHGSFAIGIATFFLFIVVKIYKEKRVQFDDLLFFTISLGSTLINPYGIRLWGEVYQQMSDSSLRWFIQEWMPGIFSFYPAMWVLFAFSAFFLVKFRKNFGFFEKILYVGLLISGLSSIRHMAFWIIVALPILSKGLYFFNTSARKIKYGQDRFNKAYVFSLFLAVFIVFFPLVSSFKNPFLLSEENFYPKKAVNYLKNHASSGQVFSDHGWGGYLIWKYPEKKVFLDGRMNSWRSDTNKKNESSYAFGEFGDLMSGNAELKVAVEKYNIDTVLLPVRSENPQNRDKSSPQIFLERLENRLEGKFFSKKKYADIYTQLKNGGWKIVYEDEIAVIYRKY